jgi:rubredoxin
MDAPRGLSRRRAFVLGALALLSGSWRPRTARASTPPGDRLARWVCTNADCDPYIYDPVLGDVDNINGDGHPIPPGVAFEDLADDWLCPNCGSPKSFFKRMSS